MKYKHIFGPVPSRRLGNSLGIDIVYHKVCSLDCVYCEVGKTTLHTAQRAEYIPYEKIVEELKDYFNNNPDPDYITFSGSGEPALNSRIGDIINFIGSLRPDVPIAVLTNGTLFYDKSVRNELSGADLVLPSLDAISQEIFNKINRPVIGLDVHDHIQGLIDFRKEYKGQIWLEVFILPDYNTSKEELIGLKKAIKDIAPDKVQLNSLDRPGTVRDIKEISEKELNHIKDILNFKNIEIVKSARNRRKIESYSNDTESMILQTLKRRPCTIEDICEISQMNSNEISKYLDVLEKEYLIKRIRKERGIFYIFS